MGGCMGVLMPRGGSAPPFCLPLSRRQQLLTPSRGVRGGRGWLSSCPCPSRQQGQGCLSPLCPHLPPNPLPGAGAAPWPVPDPAPRLDVVSSRLPVPRPGDVAVAAPCPAPVPSVPRGRGRVGVLPPGSWLCFPAVCACVSPPSSPLLTSGLCSGLAVLGTLVRHCSPPQPPPTSCSCWHTNPLSAGGPAGGHLVRWPWHVPIPIWGNGAASPISPHQTPSPGSAHPPPRPV